MPTEAIDAWQKNLGNGVVVLPTGAGKTWVALMAMALKQRSTLVVAPTLDLVRQWYDVLSDALAKPSGLWVAANDVQDITVTTYDSAFIHMERFGDKFGMLVFDECHHLPGPSYAQAARLSLAPFRLGLTATPERADDMDRVYPDLIGPIVYRQDIVDLSGDYLADYDTIRITVDLSLPSVLNTNLPARPTKTFSNTRASQWPDLMGGASLSCAPPAASQVAERWPPTADKKPLHSPPAKLDHVDRLLNRHKDDRLLLFTQDNATVYAASRRF